jgi:hypothetical protein
VKTYEDRELSEQMKALAGQISVPPGTLGRRQAVRWGRALPAMALVALLALVVAATITGLRAAREGSVVAPTTPTPTLSSAPTTIAFPDLTLFAGTSNGFVSRVESGRVVGNPVEICPSRAVLVLQPSAGGRWLLVVCGGPPEGSVVVLDTTTLALRAGPMPVVSRDDVAAWSPDERSIALLQTGRCDPQAPVCAVHLSLWNLSDNSTTVIRADDTLMGDVRWTPLGLSVAFTQHLGMGTIVWDGQAWHDYAPQHRLRVADASGRALLVEAGTGNDGGRVWLREGGQERALTQSLTVTEYPLALDGPRALVWRDATAGPGGSIVIYNGARVDEVALQGFCASAQQVGRWMVCTRSGSSALAFSLDTNQLTIQAISGLSRFNALAAIPRG